MNKHDLKLYQKLILEINANYKKLIKLIPEGNSPILKHLAASSIH